MISDIFLFASSLLLTGAISFLLIYFVITISDFECDHLNARECCSVLNFWTIPKLGVQSLITFGLLIDQHYWLFLSNLPIVIYTIHRLRAVPRGNIGLYDPTEMYNRGEIHKHLRTCSIYLGFHVVMFFIFMYYLITSLIDADVTIKYHDQDEIIDAM